MRPRFLTSAAILFVVFVGYALGSHIAQASHRNSDLAWINPYWVRYVEIYDSVPRNKAFKFGVMALALLIVLLDWFRDRWSDWGHACRAETIRSAFTLCAAFWGVYLSLGGRHASLAVWVATLSLGLLAVMGLSRSGRGWAGIAYTATFTILALSICKWAYAASLSQGPSLAAIHAVTVCLLLSTPFWPSFGPAPRRLGASPGWLLAILMAGAFVASAPMGAFHKPLDLGRWSAEALSSMELHVDMFVTGPAQSLAAGRKVFREVTSFYGVGYPILFAALKRFFGLPIDLSMVVRVGLMADAAFLALSAFLFYRYCRNRIVPTALFSLFIISWGEFAAPALTPTHSSMRFLGVPLFFLLLWENRDGSAPAQLFRGCAMLGICALISPEISIALTAAYCAYSWFRWRTAGPWARVAAAAASLAGAGLAMVVLSLSAILLMLPASARDFSMLELLKNVLLMSRFSSGFGGLDFTVTPEPFLIGLISILTLADIAAGTRSESPRNAFRAALAVFTIVWGAYFVNRPAYSNLRISYWTTAYFLIDIARSYSSSTRTMLRDRNARISELSPWLVSAGILAACGAPLTVETVRGVLDRRASPPLEFAAPGEKLIAGVRVPEFFANDLQSARATWDKHATPGAPCLMLTSHPIFASAVMCRSDLPFMDPFLGAMTIADYRRTLSELRQNRNGLVFIDTIADQPDEDRRDFFKDLRARIASDYRLVDGGPHLEVWARRPTLPSSDSAPLPDDWDEAFHPVPGREATPQAANR